MKITKLGNLLDLDTGENKCILEIEKSINIFISKEDYEKLINFKKPKPQLNRNLNEDDGVDEL